MMISSLEMLVLILLFMSIQLFVFIQNRKAKLLLLNLLPSLLLSIPLICMSRGITPSIMILFIYAGILIYPYTFILLTADYFPLKKKNFFLYSLFLSLPFLLLFFNTRNISFVLLMHSILYIFLFLSVKKRIPVRYYIIFVLFFSLFILLYNYNNIYNQTVLASMLVLQCIITSFFVLYDYSRRLRFINLRLQSINALNKRLNQVITRIRQSNDTLKKIISQKDIELLQIARHASLAEVTTGIAHELTQPLTGIKCISQNMIDDINYNELDQMQAVSDLAKIASLVDRSSSIIDHIRTFSRKRGFSFQEADLNACILNAIELINNQIKNNGIDLIFVLDDSVPRIYGDNLSLEQLFINLILNSRDAISSKIETSGNFTGVIKITTTYQDGIVKLIIEDNGTGIPDDVIPKIWTPFFTTKQKGKGTGIGLSLSHRIIKEHNADVSISSSSDGTIFTIIFPVEQPHQEEQLQS